MHNALQGNMNSQRSARFKEAASLQEDDENANRSLDEVAPGEHNSKPRLFHNQNDKQRVKEANTGSKIQINKVNEMDIKVSRFEKKTNARFHDFDGQYAIEEVIPNEEPLI